MLPLVQTWRDLREFLDAKKRKREPVRLKATGGATAVYAPRSFGDFTRFRSALRVGDYGAASEGVDRLEHELRARNSVGLPLPRKLLQNEDRSLTLFWEGATVRSFPDRFVSVIGGTDGVTATRITSDLLDLLAFQSRIQRA